MDLIKHIILGIIQGFTEPLPISTSGHIFLFKSLFNPNMFNNTEYTDTSIVLGDYNTSQDYTNIIIPTVYCGKEIDMNKFSFKNSNLYFYTNLLIFLLITLLLERLNQIRIFLVLLLLFPNHTNHLNYFSSFSVLI